MTYPGRLWLIAALLFACFVTRPCHADIDRYSNPAGFQAAIADATTIDFEGLVGAGETRDYGNPGSLTMNGVTFASNGSLMLKNTNAHGTGAYLAAQADSTDVTITLPAGTTAIGFNVGIESFGTGSIGVELATGETFQVNSIDYPDLKFYALTSTTPIISLHLTKSFTNSNAISLDNVTIGHRAISQRHYVVDATYQGFGYVFFRGLNNYGDLCGYTFSPYTSSVTQAAFVWLQNGSVYYPLISYNYFVEAAGINDSGVAILNSSTDSRGLGYYDTYFWTIAQDKTFIGSFPYGGVAGINNSNQVAVTPLTYVNGVQTDIHASILQNNTLYDLGALNYSSIGYAINNKGQVTGYANLLSGVNHAFLGAIGTPMVDLGTPYRDAFGGFTGDTIGLALNDKGDVVGIAQDRSGSNLEHAFLYHNGVMQDLGTLPGFEGSEAKNINNAGQVVGNLSHSGPGYTLNHGFLWQNGLMTDINDLLPARYANVSGYVNVINERGQIAYSSYVGYLLTPEALDVSDSVRVGSSGLIYNRQTRTYNATVTLTNTGQDPILGPLQMEFVGLTPGAALVNQTGTHNGNPYYYHNAVITLLPGQSTSVPVQFSYTGSNRLSYSVRTYTGAFQQ